VPVVVSMICENVSDRDCWRKAGRRWSPVSQTGFTLIELLVVFTILALLLTLATPRYLNTMETGKTKVQAQNIATLRDAIDKFRADQGRYPSQLEEVVAKQYLRQIPLDPVSGTRDWKSLPPPNSAETGIYDIQAPDVLGPLLPLEATAVTQGDLETDGVNNPGRTVSPVQPADSATPADPVTKP
jgi:general secretion pathway protein G